MKTTKTQKNNPGLSILVAEDDELSYLYLNIILKSFSQKIDRAKDGIEALEFLSSNQYDVALLDVNLPKLSGLEIANLIHEKYPATGIIMNSAFSLEKEREEAMEKSDFEYLSKPLLKENLISAIEKVSDHSIKD